MKNLVQHSSLQRKNSFTIIVRCLTGWIHPDLPMASISDSFQNIPMSPFCDLENVFCDIKFIDLNGGGWIDYSIPFLRSL